MNHARYVIREVIVAALKTGVTAVGNRVADNPADPQRELPCLAVEDLGEAQETPTLPGGAGRLVNRTLVLVVHVKVTQNLNYARVRDQISADVEATLATVPITGAKYLVPSGVEFDTSSDGEHPVAIARQRFTVFYQTTQGNPATAI